MLYEHAVKRFNLTHNPMSELERTLGSASNRSARSRWTRSGPCLKLRKTRRKKRRWTCCLDTSGVRFSDFGGNVEVQPAGEDYWNLAKIGMVLNEGDHVRTGVDSIAIISFKDITTFTMKPESEIILSQSPKQESKLQLVAGNLWANIKKMAKDGTMEITMNQAVLGIKGTTFVCETTATTSTLKVIEGSVEFKDKNGKTVIINGGEKVTATGSGMGVKEAFDVALEKKQWEGLTTTSSSTNWGLIIGIVVAGIAVLFVILWLVFRERKLKPAN
jgi:hypothetical protein